MAVYEFFKWLFLFSVSQLGLCLATNDRKPNRDLNEFISFHIKVWRWLSQSY